MSLQCPRNNPLPIYNTLLFKSLWTDLDFMPTFSHREAGKMGLNTEMTGLGLSQSITWNWTQKLESVSKGGLATHGVHTWIPAKTERPASQQGSRKGTVMTHARLRYGKGLGGT